MKKKVFISYSSIQEEEANRICSFLESNNLSCFMSSRDIVPGTEYAEQLLEAIDDSRVVVLLLSEEANSSPHVLREIEYAVSHKKPIIVYELEDVVLSRSMEYYLMTHQWLSMNDMMRDEVLLTSVRNILMNREDDLHLEETVLKKQKTKNVVVYPKWMIVLIIVLSTILIILLTMLIIDIRSGALPKI